MFSKATANFVRQIDPEGSLIHVTRVNDSHKLVPMALVVKRKRIWIWQRPKYQPTDFTLSDLLLGDKVLRPEVSEIEFLTYKGTFGDEFSSKLETEPGPFSVALEGQGSFKLKSSFGQLKKEELEVKKLLLDSSNRLVDMQHVLVQQLEKRAEVLAVVKERIFTTNSCSVTLKKKEQFNFQGVLRLLGMLGDSVKVCVNTLSNSIEADSDVSLEIPSGTVIAYSILELKIKQNGLYEIRLQPGLIGGFEEESALNYCPSDDSLNTVDGKSNRQKVPEEVPSSALENASQEMDLSPLAELPPSNRCALMKRLQETLRDRPALSCLQHVLEELCDGKTLREEEQPVSAILDQTDSDSHTENSQGGIPAHLAAAHLLVSAMEELPDETLSLLSKSSPDFLEAFDILMCRLKESIEPLSLRSLPVLLQDNQAFQLAEQLLSSTKVTLRRDTERLWMETGSNARVLPLVLCLSVHGLSLLCSGLK